MIIESNSIIEQKLNFYYKDNARQLHKKVDRILRKFGGISNKDIDDFYSIANEVFTDVLRRYDKSQSFDTFLSSCLLNKIKTEMTARNREKRKSDRLSISIDTPIGEDGNMTIGDTLQSDFNIENELEIEEYFEENTISYLDSLSKTQRKIANMLISGELPSNIKSKLKLTDKQYDNHLQHMRCFEKASILKRNNNIELEEETMNNNQTFEKSKVDKYNIASIIKKIDNGTLRYDHPLQRESDQHSTKMKSNLVSDILQGNPIPALVFAEQIINGISIIWNLDGKQRSTTVKEFAEDKFKISKSVRRNIIRYQEFTKDENGLPQGEWKEFDIANKRFSQLPDVLKDNFMEYCFDITLYMNCSDGDIAYHIERYNDGKQMVSSQKSVIKLGEDYARMIKGISAMPFFSENGFNYTQKKNGTVDRVCIESVMATEFLEDWKSSPEEIATYLKKNATEEHFDNLEDTVERLEKVVTENIGELFNKKDAFIYFSVFAKFKKTGLEDMKFVEFLTEYAQSINKEFEEIEYDRQNNKKKHSTKDKCVVVDKINIVEKLMKEYLHIEDYFNNKCENTNIKNKEVTAKDILKEFVMNEVTDEDVELYEMITNDKSESIKEIDSWILSDKNRPALVALVGAATQVEDEDKLDEWLPIYERNNTYIPDLRQNYLHMLNDFKKYCKKGMVA